MNKGVKVVLFGFVFMVCFLTQARAATYKIDQSHSTIGFAVKHMVVSTTRGNFADYTGVIEFDENDLSTFQADITIQAASINTQNEARDNHLRSPDFFEVETYPTITFRSTNIVEADGGYKITGDFTMRGVTKQIVIPVFIEGPIQSRTISILGLAGEVTINRQDFGVSWSKVLDSGSLIVDDVVRIIVELELHSQQSRM